jgi:hypothetical protein
MLIDSNISEDLELERLAKLSSKTKMKTGETPKYSMG